MGDAVKKGFYLFLMAFILPFEFDPFYFIWVNRQGFEKTVGSRAEVMHGKAMKTSGGLKTQSENNKPWKNKNKSMTIIQWSAKTNIRKNYI